MFKILEKRKLAEKLFLFVIENKRMAKSALPGQFLIVKLDEKSERIPLTICDYDKEKGTITIVVQEVGLSTKKINCLNVGDYFLDVVGPLGNPSDIIFKSKDELNNMNILFIAGGLGAAPVYPQAKYLSELGVKFDVIIGAKTKDILILENDFKKLGCGLYICTDDESYGYKGPVTNLLKMLVNGEIKDSGKKNYGHCIAIGSAIMMKFVSIATKELNIPLTVSMNTIMVDGTGMCGACRLMVGDKLKFCCVDGPEFDGHLIDFDAVIKRQAQYKTEEGRRLLSYIEGNTHHGNCGYCGG